MFICYVNYIDFVLVNYFGVFCFCLVNDLGLWLCQRSIKVIQDNRTFHMPRVFMSTICCIKVSM